jgi:hypothetical protein
MLRPSGRKAKNSSASPSNEPNEVSVEFHLEKCEEAKHMSVCVMRATGSIGSAIVKELMAAGHQMLGLTRSDAGAKSLAAAGAQVHRWDLASGWSCSNRKGNRIALTH